MNLLIRRFIAHTLDSIIVGLPAGLLFFGLNLSRFFLNLLPFVNLPGRGFWVFQANTALLLMVYEGISLYLFQTTLGKALMGLRVINLDGGASSFRLLGRTVLKAVVSQSSVWFLGLISLYIALRSDGYSSLPDAVMRTEIRRVD